MNDAQIEATIAQLLPQVADQLGVTPASLLRYTDIRYEQLAPTLAGYNRHSTPPPDDEQQNVEQDNDDPRVAILSRFIGDLLRPLVCDGRQVDDEQFVRDVSQRLATGYCSRTVKGN